MVKKSLSIRKRNPKNCSKNKRIALEFLIFLLSEYKSRKVVFVTDKAISSKLEVSVLTKRVENLEREIGVKRKSIASNIVPYKQRRKSEKVLIGAFNIANFGEAKVNRQDIMKNLLKIISRYDLIVIQEIRSQDCDVVGKTLEMLNKFCQETGVPRRYKAEKSAFVGNEHRKEQYGYFFNKGKLKLDGFRQFLDLKDDFR